jgi:glycosyltransferase involved in cell wall biosynthesis
MKEKPTWILYMATFPPRECGIATFTQDLTKAMDNKFAPGIKSKILAINNTDTNIYNYPEDVIYQISDTDISEYIDVAKRINKSNAIKLVSIQHEFGIFGGEYGSYLIAFLEILEKPAVITFHSVLPNPDEKLKRVVQTIAEKSQSIVVMTEKGIDILKEDYEIRSDIQLIHHGIPSIPFEPSSKEKAKLGYKNKILLSSFGMLNSGKGYEHVIDALPKVIEKFPDVLYLIIGETHPVVRKEQGEEYRNFLERKVKELNLQKNVKFYNKYVKLKEILMYLQATDISICSNNNPNQITSGTLVYAMGAGRVVISTPFIHAKDIVKPSRGILAEFNSPDSFAEAIIKVISNPRLKLSMEKDAYSYTRIMTWTNVALSYMRQFNKLIHRNTKHEEVLPKIKLNHLIKLTDDFGMIQFVDNTTPDLSSGYTLDDNARALIVCGIYCSKFKCNKRIELIDIYLDFIEYVQQEDGKLMNFVDYKRNINMSQWSDDAHGRGIWSLGFLLSLKEMPDYFKKKAKRIFTKAINAIESIKSPRATAFIIFGLYYYNLENPSEENIIRIKELATHLVNIYHDQSSEEWTWFETYLTYSNSRLSESLFYAYLATKEEEFLEVAKKTLDFLICTTLNNGQFAPVGHDGWYFKNGKKAYYDQQPVDTAAMVQTLLVANKVTGEEKYLKKAIVVFSWFLGNNALNQMVYDESSGGCHDGVGQHSINLNQGAESTISYLLARLSFD